MCFLIYSLTLLFFCMTLFSHHGNFDVRIKNGLGRTVQVGKGRVEDLAQKEVRFSIMKFLLRTNSSPKVILTQCKTKAEMSYSRADCNLDLYKLSFKYSSYL